MTIRTLCVLGTRPEAIKMIPLIEALSCHSGFINKVCLTGQHSEMLYSVFDLFGVMPDFNLKVMQKNQDLSSLTAKILLEMEGVLQQFSPDMILVHGDTTTALAAALVAFYHRISIGHVEAGLRTHDLLLPWPEEGNRKLIGTLADLHFASTQIAKMNLLREGVNPNTIVVTGNTVIDASRMAISLLQKDKTKYDALKMKYASLTEGKPFILVTGHRRENFGEGFENICDALSRIADAVPHIDIVYPVHLNPNVQKPVMNLLSQVKNIHLIEPVDYLNFVYLMKTCYLILTDSGGIQEEASFFNKPVLVMRDKTERPEALSAGLALLVGTHTDSIFKHVLELINNTALYEKMTRGESLYGDGRASLRIIDALKEKLTEKKHLKEPIQTFV